MRKEYILILFLLILSMIMPVSVLAVGPGDVFEVLGIGGYPISDVNYRSNNLTIMPTGLGNGPNSGDLYLGYGYGYAYVWEVQSSGTMTLVNRQSILADFGSSPYTNNRYSGQWAYSGYSDVYVLLAAGSDAWDTPTLGTYHISSAGLVNTTIIAKATQYGKSYRENWFLYRIEGTDDVIGSFSTYEWGPRSNIYLKTWDINPDGSITPLSTANVVEVPITIPKTGLYPGRLKYLWDNATGPVYGITYYKTAGTGSGVAHGRFSLYNVNGSGILTLLDSFYSSVAQQYRMTFERLGNSYDLLFGYEDGTLGVMDCTISGSVNGFAGTTTDWTNSQSSSNYPDIRYVGGDLYNIMWMGCEPDTACASGNTFIYQCTVPEGTTNMDSSYLDNWERFPSGWDTIDPISLDFMTGNPGNYFIVSSGTSSNSMAYAMILSEGGSGTPTLTTSSPTNLTSSTFTANGAIVTSPGSDATLRGFVWNTTGNPTTSDYGWYETGTFSAGSFSGPITGVPLTSIYLRSFATNDFSTGYGNQIEVSLGSPIVYTLGVANVGTDSATGQGYLASFGSSMVTRVGICWSSSGSPTISDNICYKETGIGIAQYYCDMEGMVSNDIYYMKAYATNSYGTGYGNEISFMTVPSFADNTTHLNFEPWNLIPPSSPGTITDVSGYGNDASYILADMIDGVTVYVSAALSGGGHFYPGQSDLEVPNKWIVPPQSGMTQQGDSSNLPLYDLFSQTADDIGMEVAYLYIMMTFGIAMGLGFLFFLISGSIFVSILSMSIILMGFFSTGVMPFWIIIFFIVPAFGTIYLYRQT